MNLLDQTVELFPHVAARFLFDDGMGACDGLLIVPLHQGKIVLLFGLIHVDFQSDQAHIPISYHSPVAVGGRR